MKRVTQFDFLGDNFTCEELVQCFYGLNELEFSTYCTLLKIYESGKEWFTVNDIQDVVGKEKTMVNRALKKLSELGLVTREKKTSTSLPASEVDNSTPKRGYYFVYTPLSLDDLMGDLKEKLEKWYEHSIDQLGHIKDTFKNKYNLSLNKEKLATSQSH